MNRHQAFCEFLGPGGAFGQGLAQRNEINLAARLRAFIEGSKSGAGFGHHVEGEPRAVVTQRRLRMYPESGGAGTVIETTHNARVRELGVELFRALKWHGPGQAEFRVDSRDGTPTLLEINGRFWGSTDLGARAGVDFPLLTARLARDGDVEAIVDYAVGVRYRWPLPFGVLGVLRGTQPREALSTFFTPARGVHSDISLSDPLPTLGQLWWTVRELARKA